MINLLLSGNYKVFDGALSELISIINKTKETINCYILTMDVSRIKPDYISMSDEQIKFLNKVVKSYNYSHFHSSHLELFLLYVQHILSCPNLSLYYKTFLLYHKNL